MTPSKTCLHVIGLLAFSSFFLLWKAPVDASQTTVNNNEETMTINYTIWIGDIPSEVFSIILTVPTNTTFHDIMKIAEKEDKRFKFSGKKFSFGFYVTTISGVKEDVENSRFWLLYSLPEPPELENLPGNELLSSVGVSDLIPSDGDNILFWYHQF